MKVGKDTALGADIIKKGGITIFPTETVYGIGANALNPEAVSRIFAAKERPSYDPLIVHIASADQVDDVASCFPEKARKLAEVFWPGPLTLILPKKDTIPDSVTSGLPSVGVRMPSHPVALDFLTRAACPVAAPSANKFGYISPTETSHLKPLEDSVDYILEGGSCEVGVESTIISLVDNPVILRKGGISREQIEEIIGPVEEKVNSSSRPAAPGMLLRHYAPKTPLIIYREGAPVTWKGKTAFLALGDNVPEGEFQEIYNLSKEGDLDTAARKLYSAMRLLDDRGYDFIVTRFVENSGVGRAINDKLTRAEAK